MNQPIDVDQLLFLQGKLGLTQEELAEELGVSRRLIQYWISNYANGESVSIHYKTHGNLVRWVEKNQKDTGIGPDRLEPDLKAIDVDQLLLLQHKLELSLEELGEELRVAPGTIQKWEKKHAKGKVVSVQYRTYIIFERLMGEDQKDTGIGPDCLEPEPKEPGGARHDPGEGQPPRAECGVDEAPRKAPATEPELEPQTHVPEPVEVESGNVGAFRGMPVLEPFQRTSRNPHSARALAGAVGAMAAIGVLFATTSPVLEKRGEAPPQPVLCELGTCEVYVELENYPRVSITLDELSDGSRASLVSDLAFKTWLEKRR